MGPRFCKLLQSRIQFKAATLLAFLCLCALLGRGYAQRNPADQPSVADWRQDLDELVRDILAYHPNPFTKTGKLAFLREAEDLKSALPQLSQEQRMVRVMRLVASIGDGHTEVEPDSPRFSFWYPFRIYEFTDGFFVTSAHRLVAELAGAQVLGIAGRPPSEVTEEARKLMGADNAFGRMEKLYALHNAGLMTGLGFAAPNGDLQVKFKLRDGSIFYRRLSPHPADDPDYKGSEAGFEWQFRGEMYGMPIGGSADWLSAFQQLPAIAFQTPDQARPLHLIGRLAFISRAIPDRSAYYIQANQVNDTDFVPSFRKALFEVDHLKPKYLIVDLRYNFGGDGSQVVSMIHEFVKREGHQPWGALYILTGRRTFSAAIMALHEFIEHVQYTLIGEPPGAPLNSYGDAISRKYSRTGLHLKVSTLWHQLSDSNNTSEFIPVDVPAMFSFTEYATGRDPAVDPILEGKEMRSIPVIARLAGGAAARRVWLERKQRFAQVPWWKAAREIDLRNTCRALFAENRITDALETCKLSTEIHPYNWHSWFNLGLLQRRVGRDPEAFASYQCVNRVDPNNHNAQAIREVLKKKGAENAAVPSDCP